MAGDYGFITPQLTDVTDGPTILGFYQTAQEKEFARKFQFKILQLGPLDGKDRVYFTTANVPQRTISNQTVPFMGLQYNIPGAAQYSGSDSWQVTFRCDEASNIRAKLLGWQDEIFNIQQSGGKYGVPVSQAIICQLGKNLEETRRFVLQGIWPTQIGELQFDITDAGSVQTFNATFAYQFWFETSPQNTAPQPTR